jgi:hypothetical protein
LLRIPGVDAHGALVDTEFVRCHRLKPRPAFTYTAKRTRSCYEILTSADAPR